MKTLLDADPGPFRIIRITDKGSERRLADLKVGPGDLIEKLEPAEETAPALRIRTSMRSGVIGGEMSLGIWVRHDETVTTLATLSRRARAVVTALSGGRALAETAQILGIREGEEIRLLHRLPPMDYVFSVAGKRERLGEGEAAKIWGRRRLADGTIEDEDLVQLTSLGAGQILLVDRLTAGRRASGHLEGLGIRPGVEITVEGVEPRQTIRMGKAKVVHIRTRPGIEIWLGEGIASYILGEKPPRETP